METCSVGIRLNVFEVNDWNHPNCVPSCTLVGDTEIVALVSKSAVLVRVRSHVEVVVDASTRVTSVLNGGNPDSGSAYNDYLSEIII